MIDHWRSKETAPRDGTKILICYGDFGETAQAAFWHAIWGAWRLDKGYFVYHDACRGWAPLPVPATEEKKPTAPLIERLRSNGLPICAEAADEITRLNEALTRYQQTIARLRDEVSRYEYPSRDGY